METRTEKAAMEQDPTPIGTSASHYASHAPNWFTVHVFNKLVALLTRLGVSVWGSRVLEHRGRRSGDLFHTPVNLLTYEGVRYLVAPRGETQWVRNVRAADGHLVLILGRHRMICTATEVPTSERADILRAYLRRWKFEVGTFFDGTGPDASDEEMRAVTERHPVFAII